MEALSAVIDAINRAGAIHWDFASTMFVQVVALVAVLGLVELCLRRRVRPAVRYWLWALVVLKLLLPVTLRTPASVAYWVVRESLPTANSVAPPADARQVPSPVVNSLEPATAPLVGQAEPLFVAEVPSPSAPREMHRPPMANDEMPVAVVVSPPLPRVNPQGWIFLGWCGGCLVLGAIVLCRTVRVCQLVRRARKAPREMVPPLEVACSLLDLSARRIRLRISAEVGCPAVCGFWRPTVLIPERLVGRLDEEQLQLVFVHELAHWKRWDLQINLLQTVLQVVYFYNPAVWLASGVLRRIREEAVDDAVLVALAAPAERYSQTLLEVAAQTLRPIEAGVHLIGILESRPALVRRIYRLAIQPLPRTARLGLGGLVAVSLTGLALLPMAGGPRVANKALPNDDAHSPEHSVALRGKITDEAGKPIADARIQLVRNDKRVREVRTGSDGRYTFQRPAKPGRYALLIEKDGYLGFLDANDAPHVDLDSQKQVGRNFSLRKACRLRLQTVDDGGRPMAGVHLLTPGLAKIDPKGTNRDGWITIEGMEPAAYVFAAERDDLVTTRLDVTVDSPNQVVERRLVLKRGTKVKGKLVSWDGKPAAGWEVVAVPTWWSFPQKPRGQTVGPDGTFVLPQVGPGKYNLSLVVPSSGLSMPLVAGVDLSHRTEPLSLRADLPSPGWQCAIDGNVRFVGAKPKQPIRVFAQSLENDGFRQSARIRDTFRLGPIPPGRYQLTFESPQIKTIRVSVVAPVAGLKVDIETNSPIPINGVVSVPGAHGLQPLGDFRVRVLQWNDPFGTKFASLRQWRPFNNAKGEYRAEFPGPGLYVVEAAADGYAIAQSQLLNAENVKEGVNLTLTKCVRLTGMVVDESGQPINGAVVNSLAKADGHLRGPRNRPTPGTFAETVDGRFEFNDLAPGLDTFRVDHPEYASSVAEKVKLPRDGDQPLRIVMQRGGTIRGHVLDDEGHPLEGVKLRLRRTQAAFAGDLDIRDLGMVATDEKGDYEVHALPEQLIHIWKLGGGGRSPGVFFKSVVPSRSKVRTVDFGGPSSVSGQLFVDGSPFGRTLMLGDEDFNSGTFAAKTYPAADGSFAFSGVPLGKHCLFASGTLQGEWVRIRELEVHSAEQRLGRIDFGVARLTVNVAGILKGQKQEDVYVHDYNPTPFRRSYVARPSLPHTHGREFVFDHVGFGKYDLVAHAGNVRLNQMIEITPKDLNPAATITWPAGTASLVGTVDPKLAVKSSVMFVALASRDERWSERLPLRDDGRFRFAGVPAGRYSLSLMPLRLTCVPVLVAEMTFGEGEAKTLDITKAAIPEGEFTKGVLRVDAYTSDGVPLSGAEITLTGAKGPLKPQLCEGGQTFFVAPAGVYQLTAAYAGVKTVTQTVEIKPILGNANWSRTDQIVKMTLARDQ